jgi:hypothetical protein
MYGLAAAGIVVSSSSFMRTTQGNEEWRAETRVYQI